MMTEAIDSAIPLNPTESVEWIGRLRIATVLLAVAVGILFDGFGVVASVGGESPLFLLAVPLGVAVFRVTPRDGGLSGSARPVAEEPSWDPDRHRRTRRESTEEWQRRQGNTQPGYQLISFFVADVLDRSTCWSRLPTPANSFLESSRQCY